MYTFFVAILKHNTNTYTYTHMRTHHYKYTHIHLISISTFEKLDQLDLEIDKVRHQWHISVDKDVT
jgi:hypothetical protein